MDVTIGGLTNLRQPPQVLQKAEADKWQGSPVKYNPLAVHTAVPLIIHEHQRLDSRLKTLAVSGGRPKFSASGLGRTSRKPSRRVDSIESVRQ